MEKINNDDLKIAELLTLSLDKFTTSSVLRNATGIKPVAIRLAIRKLRNDGYPIIANNSGYKLAADRDELRNYIHERSLEINREHDVIIQLAKILEGNMYDK